MGGAAEESIDQVAETEQVFLRAGEGRILGRVGGGVEVRPFRRDERLTSVRQNENELQAAAHARVAEHLQSPSLERVMQACDGHPFRKVLMVGSVWWLPSTTFRKIC